MAEFEIECICDNNVKLSSKFWGEHGISFLIEGDGKKLLFDTGQTGAVLNHNLNIVKKNISDLDLVVLSHGHYDHTGGLMAVVDNTPIKIIAHPTVFDKKYKMVDGTLHDIGIPFKKDILEDKASFIYKKNSFNISKNIITTGEIPRVFSGEKVPENFLVEKEGKLTHDEIIDDQSVILNGDNGALVLLGCNHAGIMNTINYCKTLVDNNIIMAAGGTHLVNASKHRLKETINYLKKEKIKVIGFHCTGKSSAFELKRAMGNQFERGYCGMHISFD
ncbi:MAG: MBL fold metallo-hydrolase [Candidatus Methanofastidiosia archaeon]